MMPLEAHTVGDLVERAALRTAWAARALDEAAADVFAARRAGADIGSAGVELEQEAGGLTVLAGQIASLPTRVIP